MAVSNIRIINNLKIMKNLRQVALVTCSLFLISACSVEEEAVSPPAEPIVNIEEAVEAVIEPAAPEESPMAKNLPKISAVDHASAVVEWENLTVFIDPVGDQVKYESFGTPDVVVITHVHGDHLSVDTMIGMLSRETIVLAPQSVIDELPLMISNNTFMAFNPGVNREVGGVNFTAIPAYNIRPEAINFHPKERGDIGVVMESGEARIYFSGDSEGTPEMLALKDIDMAFVAMNLPYTMNINDAANAVAVFAPKTVVPYHYRTPNGFSNLDQFEEILFELNPNVGVERMNWYIN